MLQLVIWFYGCAIKYFNRDDKAAVMKLAVNQIFLSITWKRFLSLTLRWDRLVSSAKVIDHPSRVAIWFFKVQNLLSLDRHFLSICHKNEWLRTNVVQKMTKLWKIYDTVFFNNISINLNNFQYLSILMVQVFFPYLATLTKPPV